MIVAVEESAARPSVIRRHLAMRYDTEGRPHPEWCAALVVARAEAELDLEAAATRLGCPADVLSKLEQGERPPSSAPPEVLRKLWSLPSRPSRILGCVLGGAVGDALGAPIEFDSLAVIAAATGGAGVDGYRPAYGRLGAVTDDTQMTLFTAEGILRADPGDDAIASVHRSYLRWMATQGRRDADDEGWLLRQEFL